MLLDLKSNPFLFPSDLGFSLLKCVHIFYILYIFLFSSLVGKSKTVMAGMELRLPTFHVTRKQTSVPHIPRVVVLRSDLVSGQRMLPIQWQVCHKSLCYISRWRKGCWDMHG